MSLNLDINSSGIQLLSCSLRNVYIPKLLKTFLEAPSNFYVATRMLGVCFLL